MSNLKTLPLNKIHVPADRSREVDEDHARVIQASILEQGQITPIMVRHTPNGKQPYELIAGAHRCYAVELNGDEEIDCIIVKADEHEAALLEVSENIFRNELTALDRAMAVQVYRDAWEEKYGKIKRGGDQRGKMHLCSNAVNVTELLSEEVEGRFSEVCADKLGLSKDAIKRSNTIAKALPKELRTKLQGTPAADNQSQLLKLARLEPVKLKKAAEVIETLEGDVAAAIDVLEDKKKVNRSQAEKQFSTLVDTWGRATPKTRQKFMDEMGLVAKSETKD